MLRIISGSRKGFRIAEVDRDNTRPTTDKNKELLFNTIGQYFPGGNCLDLFAGSGSLGFEALSRGFDKCYFVDISRKATKVIRENMLKLRYSEGTNCEVVQTDWQAFVKESDNLRFDLVLADPPYAFNDHRLLLQTLASSGIVANGGIVVLETGKDTVMDKSYFNLTLIKDKLAGAARFHFFVCDIK